MGHEERLTELTEIRGELEARGGFLGEGVILEGSLAIGNNVKLWHNCVVGFSGGEYKPTKPFLVPAGGKKTDVTSIGSGTTVSPNVIVHKGAKIGKNVFISENSTIGEKTTIGDRTVVEYGAKIYNHVRIGTNSIVGGFACNDSIIENRATMLGHLLHTYPMAMSAQKWNNTKERPKAPRIENNAVVAYNAIIIGDVTIGHHSYVAAGAIITKDVPPYERRLMKIQIERKRLKGDS